MNRSTAGKSLKTKLDDLMDQSYELNDLPGLAAGLYIGRGSLPELSPLADPADSKAGSEADSARISDPGSNSKSRSSTGTGSESQLKAMNDAKGRTEESSASCFEYISTRGYRDFTMRSSCHAALLHHDDIFHCASVSKLFTSAAILMLINASDELSLNSRVAELLPDLPFADKRFRNIRLWNMLTHTSGLGDCSDYHWDNPQTGLNALRDYVYSDEVCMQPMLWLPQGSPASADNKFRYSNVAYEILGHIVSEYSQIISPIKLSYEEFISKYLLEPAGMTSSSMNTFARRDRNTGRLARPHVKAADNSIIPAGHYPYNRAHAPSSTLTSNVTDLLRWGRLHINSCKGRYESPVIFSKDFYNVIWREYATVPNNGEKMGLGWFMRKQKAGGLEYSLYGHEGTDDGFRASFWICPELELVSAVLSNISNAPVKKINKRLFALAAETIH